MAQNRRDDAMLTVEDVSNRLSVHKNTVRHWSNKGLLKTYRIGPRGDRRFLQKDLNKFLASKLQKPEIES